MTLRIEQDCPQCGGPLEMDETDRLLRCGFCSVQSFLCNTGPLHFILPRKQPDPYTIYASYLRFKGAIYSCLDDRIEHRLADISMRGVNLSFLPASLGLRPQAMKMRFATPDFPGSFLKQSTDKGKILKRAARNLLIRDEKILHQAFVGDALNIIHLPLSIRDGQVLDGITENPLYRIPENGTPFAEVEIDDYAWQPAFLPALCPKCGWNLDGEPDSVVLFCTNCDSGWQAGGNFFTETPVTVTPAPDRSARYIPFWSHRVSVSGLPLETFADFIRITNQALVIKPEWESIPFHFVTPAFKVRPDDFLRLSIQMTVGRRYRLKTDTSIPAENLYPVTLADTDSGQSLKTVLAHSAVSRRAVFPRLPAIDIRVTGNHLHYLPFVETSHELRQPETGVTINRRVLNYGRTL
jgi:hypothetical protein